MILHFDLSTGASGDKVLGALLGLCEKLELTSFDELVQQAKKLLPQLIFEQEMVMRGGISARHLRIAEHHNPSFDYEKSVSKQHHHKAEEADGAQAQHQPPQRTWKTIRTLIHNAADQNIVSSSAAAGAIRAFTRVAEAEAQVHGVLPEQVHFHEVGAADSIIDILFSSILLDLLNPSAIYATPLALGNGTFVCAHGELPVPAPATAEILAQSTAAVYASSHEGELTTPTGAALVAEFVTEFAPLPCSQPLAIAYGAGSRDLPGGANVTRVISAEPYSFAGLSTGKKERSFVEGVTLLETNLDHLSAEAAAFACEELLLAGALDVWQEAITMKKGRLASKLMVLAKAKEANLLAQQIIALTGSLGVRSSYLERTVIARQKITLDTPYGPVPFKAAWADAPLKRSHWIRPEHDAVAYLARKHNLMYRELYVELQTIAEKSEAIFEKHL